MVALTRITDKTFMVNGGYANSFLHFVSKKECILLDPGVTPNFMTGYFHANAECFRKAGSKVLRGREIREVFSTKEERTQFIRDFIGEFSKKPDFPLGNLSRDDFNERGKGIVDLLRKDGCRLLAIYATHHHIDHLGAACSFNQPFEMGVPIHLPDPEIFENGTLKLGSLATFQRVCTNGKPVVYFPYISETHSIPTVGLDGHTKMVGFILRDGCFVAGDLLIGDKAWSKAVHYLEDAKEHLETLKRVGSLKFSTMLLGHASNFAVCRDDAIALAVRNGEWVRSYLALMEKHGNDPVLAADEWMEKHENGQELRARVQMLVITALHLEGYGKAQTK